MTTHIEMIAAASNLGWPNRKNPLKPTHLAECTLEKFSRCIASRGTVSGALVSDMSAPVALPAGPVRPSVVVFRIVKIYFRITDKLTPVHREVKREKEK